MFLTKRILFVEENGATTLKDMLTRYRKVLETFHKWIAGEGFTSA
jgi:hypothetical protein